MATTKRVVSLNFNGPQLDAYDVLAPGRTIFTGWGRGVGKTFFKRQLWWLLVAQHEHRLRAGAPEPLRGVRINCLCPTLKQWKDINWAGIAEELTPPHGKWSYLRGKLDGQRGQVVFPGGSIVRAFPASDYNARTARGMRSDVLDIDEADDVDADVYDGVAVPWLSEPWSLAIELIGGTPTRGRHGLWWRTLQAGRLGEKLRNGARPEDVLSEDEIDRYSALTDDPSAGLEEVVGALKRIYSFHATYKDAPETVSRRAVARAMATTTPATFKREWEADPDAGEGLVYAFDDDFHVRQPPLIETFNEFVVGVDFGEVDPGVMLLVGMQGHGNDATAWVLREWYETECPNHVWNERAKAWAFANTFFPDPSRPDRARDFKMVGCNVGKTDNNILGGTSRVADLLAKRRTESGNVYSRLYVAPECTNTIREFGLYRRKKRPDGSFEDMPEDRNNHSMDALRYALVGRFGRGYGGRHMVSGR